MDTEEPGHGQYGRGNLWQIGQIAGIASSVDNLFTFLGDNTLLQQKY